MYVLGISAFYHDSAAALLQDGRVLCAAEEERFSRKKHDNRFPRNAVKFCLRDADISIDDVDYVAYYEKPLLKFERLLENFTRTYPRSLRVFLKGMPEWLNEKIRVERTIRETLDYRGKVTFVPHHLSHASAAFFPSPFDEAAILTIDGVGEYQTAGLWHGRGTTIAPLASISFPHSLGLLYSTFTAFLGFQVNEGEYKVMGLAAYGKPVYADQIHRVVDIKDDGSFRLNLEYFAFRESFQMWGQKFEQLFGKPRRRGEPITKRDQDLAASFQKVTEEIYFKILRHLHERTESSNVCIGGGVALNSLANGKIYSETPFTNVYIFGAAGDNGAALGAPLFTHHVILKGGPRERGPSLFLGTRYDNKAIEKVLQKHRLNYQRFDNEDALIDKVAALLAEERIVGWFQNRMEFGPRALGARSILANPAPRTMKERVNEIKVREEFRPFAGSILQERVHEYLDVPEENHASSLMTFCFSVKNEKREELAAITHHDGTCRIQTVSPENGRYYKLIRRFAELSGTPCVLNTSFNLKGEPIVENPQQAIDDFRNTHMDYLAIGDFLVSKSEPQNTGVEKLK